MESREPSKRENTLGIMRDDGGAIILLQIGCIVLQIDCNVENREADVRRRELQVGEHDDLCIYSPEDPVLIQNRPKMEIIYCNRHLR